MLALIEQQKQDEVLSYLTEDVYLQTNTDWNKLPADMSLERMTAYRDMTLWHLLCLEDEVNINDLGAYWDIMDAMMDISIESAITLLENLYEYTVRKLEPLEKRQTYPDISNDLYRLEYDDCGVYRDVCAGSLIRKAVDLLQEEAERLVRA